MHATSDEGSRLRRALPRIAVAAGNVSAVVLLCVAVLSALPANKQRRDALVALPLASSLVKETYAEDASVGEKVISRMAGRVHNPIWNELMANSKMRTALAAAIGAERLAPGGSSASAFNLGNLLSGMPEHKRTQVKQQLAGALHAPRRFERAPRAEREQLSPRREWERARARSMAHRRELSRRVQSRVGKHVHAWVPEMPDRLAANGWQQALSIQNKKKVPREHFSPQDTHHALRTNFVLDEFAPGVLPDTLPPVPPAAAAVKTAPAAPTKKASTSPPAKNLSKPVQTVKEGVEKATGFGDTIVQVGESDEDKLKEEVQHLKAMNVHEKRQFEKREKVDIEHNLLSLEAKQLHSSSSTPSPASSAPTQSSAGKSSATSIGLSASAEDEHAKLVLVGAKGDGKKVLGLLKDAEEARKAQEIAWGKIHGHLSKTFQTPQAEKLHFENEEKKQAEILENEIAGHAAIIAGVSAADEHGTQSMAAHNKGWSDSFAKHKRFMQGGWRGLAEKSKTLARKAAGAHTAATTAAPPPPTTTATASHALHVAAADGNTGARGRRGKRPHARRAHHQSESWETEIRQDSLPIVCGLPLLAEASGTNCNSVKRVHKLNGHNRILNDLKSVGLGDNEIGTGDRVRSATGPFKKGGALGVAHHKWGTQLAPSRSFGAGSAIQALGYTSAAQYEKHTLLSTIAKEEDTIERLRMKMAAKKGGIKLKTPVSSGTAAGYRRGGALASGGQQALLQRQQLENEVAREQREIASFQQQGMGARTLGAQSLASAFVSDVRGTSGTGAMEGTETYNTRDDVRYMGDKMVQTNGKGGIALELAGAVPNGLSLGTQ
mmetsp:Transcript_37005/g.54316  ORF Transcript_37005/g.54316 Transcript_37005/m.54316 type:complete len:835 (+) Transcript_37005:88-2592(+)